MPINDLSQLDLNKRYTYADYLTWRFRERVELLRGRIARMSPAPGKKHQQVSGELFFQLKLQLRESSYEIFSAPFDVRLPIPKQESPNTVVQPDICIICDPEKLDDRGCKGAPDLVVEILAPGNTHREMEEKYRLYEEAGVREYWLVDPEHEAVFPYLLSEAGQFIGQPPQAGRGVLQAHIFPNLAIDLEALFQAIR